MDLPMNQDKLKNLIASIPTDQLKSDEIEPFIQQIRKHLIEQALQGEMDTHLGYDRYKRHSGTNSRNGSSKKTLKTEKGPIAISVPRDRNDSFEPQIVPKGQTRTGVLDDQIIALYSKGISTREITETIKELYDVDMSATLISNVTGRVIN
ncbi:transposase, partial [Parasutterella secunda]|uniref:transposase n=1 Tax=Parasutterella secunda TaxID=626947 RepID=UPI00201290BA